MSDIYSLNERKVVLMLERKKVVTGLLVSVFVVVLFSVFFAKDILGVTASVATIVYYILIGTAYAGAAAQGVASFGIGFGLATLAWGLAHKWSLSRFVAW